MQSHEGEMKLEGMGAEGILGSGDTEGTGSGGTGEVGDGRQEGQSLENRDRIKGGKRNMARSIDVAGLFCGGKCKAIQIRRIKGKVENSFPIHLGVCGAAGRRRVGHRCFACRCYTIPSLFSLLAGLSYAPQEALASARLSCG